MSLRQGVLGCAGVSAPRLGDWAALASILTVVSGCDKTEFEEVETSDLVIVVNVFAESDRCDTEPDHFTCQSAVEVRLFVKRGKEKVVDGQKKHTVNANIYRLNQTESMLVRLPDEPTTPLELVTGEGDKPAPTSDGEPAYTGVVFAAPEYVDFGVELLRTDYDDALATFVRLPQDLDVTWPVIESFSRSADSITLNWAKARLSGPATDIVVTAQGSCIKDFEAVVEDPVTPDNPDTYVLEAASLEESGVGGTCDVDISVIRRREGVWDPNFADGQVYGKQVRTWTVTSVP